MSRGQNRICVITPYFGVLPDRFDLWLKSASKNPRIDFHLIGDCFDQQDNPENVFTHKLTFQELNCAIVEKLGGRPLLSPYKLCDLKPTYSILFPDIVLEYEIWGFSDLDLIFGDILGLIDFDKLPENWGRLFDFGHLSFFPNNPVINRIFEKSISWPFIRDSRLVWVFDEHYGEGLGGVNGRLEQAGFKVLGMHECFSDVVPWYRGFFDHAIGEKNNLFFLWSDGRMWRYSVIANEVNREETVYVHIQKRKFQLQGSSKHWFIVTPEHWDAIRSVDDAVCMLEAKYVDDIAPYLPRKLSYLLKAKKWAYFGWEAVTLRSGFVAFGTLIRFYFRAVCRRLKK